MPRTLERILVVDDERLARVRVADLLRAIAPDAARQEAADGATAAAMIEQWRPDAVFLDGQMPAMDGFGVVEAVGAHRMPPTVFVTAFDQHALRAFEVSAVDYLLKPFDDDRFAAAFERLRGRAAAGTIAAEAMRLGALLTSLGTTGAGGTVVAPPPVAAAPGFSGGAGGHGARSPYIDRMMVRRDQRTYLVRLADVQWIESSGNYVVLHAGRERHEVRETLAALEARLDPRRSRRRT